MKIKVIAILIICIILLSLLGCSSTNFIESNTDNSKESSIMNNTTVDSSEIEFTIYKIDSDVFDGLLEENSFDNIKNVSARIFNYPQDGDNYITYSTTVFKITDNYVELFNNKNLFKKYFSKDNPNEKIVDFIIFESPYVPISVWIKTNIDTYFLTIEDENICNLYLQSDYIEKYKSHQFNLKINGIFASKSKSVKTYYQNAELPLLEILTSCGANIKWKNEKQVSITLNNENYLLDVNNNRLYNKHSKKNNLLANCNGGGPFHMYFFNGEYYTDSATLQNVMHELNQKIEIEYDTENKIVNVITK